MGLSFWWKMWNSLSAGAYKTVLKSESQRFRFQPLEFTLNRTDPSKPIDLQDHPGYMHDAHPLC
jgi:hypothetical protein